MADVPKQADRLDEPVEMLSEPERREVTIVSWDYGTNDDVVFRVRDDAGEHMCVHFSLQPVDFLEADLDRFIAAVLGREPFGSEYFTRLQNLRMNFNTMVNKRVAMYVVETSRAKVVVDCQSIPPAPVDSELASILSEVRFSFQRP